MKRFPLLYSAIALSCGIFASVYFVDVVAGIVLAGTGVLIGIAYFFAPKLKRTLWSDFGLFQTMWSLLWFGIGLATGSAHLPRPIDTGNDVFGPTICAKVKNVTVTSGGDRITADITGFKDRFGNRIHRYAGSLFLQSSADLDFHPGDNIEFEGELMPSAFAQASASSSKVLLPTEKKYRAYTRTPHIRITGHATNIATYASAFRDRLVIKLEKSSLSEAAKQLCASILLGDKSMLSPDTRDAFRNSGLAHIIAISGLHIAIIGGILALLLFPLRNLKTRKLRYLLLIFGIWSAAIVTGLSPSACRAAVMASFILIAGIAQRKNSSLNALGAAATLILLFDPESLFNIGFQLSFVSVAAIIIFTSKLNFIDRRRFPLLYKVVESVSVTLVAVGATWALTCYYFETFPVAFLPVNLIIVPLMTPMLCGSICYIALLAIGIDFIPLSHLLSWLLGLLPDIASKFNTTVDVSIPVITPILWVAAICLAIAACHISKKRIIIVSSAVAASVAIVSALIYTPEAHTGIIVNPGNKSTEISVITNGDKIVENFERQRISSINTPCGVITLLDMPGIDNLGRSDIVIVASGFKGDLSEVKRQSKAKVLLLHSSVHTQAALELRAEAEAYGFKTHDLRQDGPFMCFIQ